MNKKFIEDLEMTGKKVLIRVDFNVPMEKGIITSEKRIDAALPTIKKALNDGAKVILLSHLGRVKNLADKNNNSLKPIGQVLADKLQINVLFSPQNYGEVLETAINNMKDGELLLLENTRYQDFMAGKFVQLESKNDLKLGEYWASLGDMFINDAFGTAHRSHASNVGIANAMKKANKATAIGYLVKKELDMLGKGLEKPKKPFIVILGGAKVSDKIGMIDKLLNKADKILIGGGMAYTFEKSQGYEVGQSLVEEDKVELAKTYLAKAGDKIVLPVDHAIAPRYANVERVVVDSINIPKTAMGLDIGPKTIELFAKSINGAKTVVWNGPMGVAEFSNFKKGTEEIATLIAAQKGVYSIIGGGDSAAAAIKLGFEDKFTHISTGGGASLEFMEGKPLPGIESIENK